MAYETSHSLPLTHTNLSNAHATSRYDVALSFCFVVAERATSSDVVPGNYSQTGAAVYVLPAPAAVGAVVGNFASNGTDVNDFDSGIYSVAFASGQTGETAYANNCPLLLLLLLLPSYC
jgi:hypothetical protein